MARSFLLSFVFDIAPIKSGGSYQITIRIEKRKEMCYCILKKAAKEVPK